MPNTKGPSDARHPLEALGIPIGLIMLAVWAVATFAFSGPGWVHLLLILGVFMVIWGIVARGTPPSSARPPRR
jgi:hypothetical protein